MKNLFLAIVLVFLGVSFTFGQTVTYQGVTLKPGDVINFHGGIVTDVIPGHPLKYGHTAMYVGMDPQTKQRSFLDFTTPKKGWEARAFGGRILAETEFLSANLSHKTFDVFRLKNASRINQKKLIREAKKSAVPDIKLGKDIKYFFDEVCSTAVAKVLRKTTGDNNIKVMSTDDFSRSKMFVRTGNKSINIQAALGEAIVRANRPPKRTTPFKRPSRPKRTIPPKRACPPGYYYCSRGC